MRHCKRIVLLLAILIRVDSRAGAVAIGADDPAAEIRAVHVQKLSEFPIDLICQMDEKSIAVASANTIVVWKFREDGQMLEAIATAVFDRPEDMYYVAKSRTLLVASDELYAWDITNRRIDLPGVTDGGIDGGHGDDVFRFVANSTGQVIAAEQYGNVPLLLSPNVATAASTLPVVGACGPIACSSNGEYLFVVTATETGTEFITTYPLVPAAQSMNVRFRETIDGITRSVDSSGKAPSSSSRIPPRSPINEYYRITSAFGPSNATYLAVDAAPINASEWPQTTEGDRVHEIWDVTSVVDSHLVQIFSDGQVAAAETRGGYFDCIAVNAATPTERARLLYIYDKGILDVHPDMSDGDFLATGIQGSVFKQFSAEFPAAETPGEMCCVGRPLKVPRMVTGHESGHVVIWNIE